MKKPIKALWLGRADNIACTAAAAGGTVSTQEVQRSVKMTMTSFIWPCKSVKVNLVIYNGPFIVYIEGFYM